MVTASLVATLMTSRFEDLVSTPEEQPLAGDGIDGPSEEEAYLQGELRQTSQ
jgi:hypothetical protein